MEKWLGDKEQQMIDFKVDHNILLSRDCHAACLYSFIEWGKVEVLYAPPSSHFVPLADSGRLFKRQ
jgi:hypothetical protein